MTCNQELLDQMGKNIKKPNIKIANDSNNEASKEEIERRLRITGILEELGISTSVFSADGEREDADILQAILLVNQGKELPEELKERIKQKQLITENEQKSE